MKIKNKKIFYFIIILTLCALCVFGTVLVHAFWYDPVSEASAPINITNTNPQTINVAQDRSSEFPVRLNIPVLNIDAKVQNVGIAKNGKMVTPNNFTDVGWYKYGTIPGHLGSAVIAGHVDDGLALPAVFNHLGDLKKSDDIYLQTENGKIIHYSVTNLTTYDYNADAETVFNQSDGYYLKLITCAGVWVPSYKTHDKRLVVTAVEVGVN